MMSNYRDLFFTLFIMSILLLNVSIDIVMFIKSKAPKHKHEKKLFTKKKSEEPVVLYSDFGMSITDKDLRGFSNVFNIYIECFGRISEYYRNKVRAYLNINALDSNGQDALMLAALMDVGCIKRSDEGLLYQSGFAY